MDYDDYVGARYGSLLRAAVLLGVSEDEAPGLVDLTLAGSARRIRRSEDPHDEVVEALVRLVPGGSGSSFGRASDEDRQRALMLAPSIDQRPGTGATDYLAALPVLDEDPPRPPVRVPAQLMGAIVAVVLLLVGAGDARILPRLLPPTPTPPPAVALRPRPITLGADQVPSLFGYGQTAARVKLTAQGWRPRFETQNTCEASGRVLSTQPSVGTHLDPGARVTVYVSTPGGVACPIGPFGSLGADRRPIAWQFLDFAAGRDAAPPFTAMVGVVIDHSEATILTRRQARSRGPWGSVLRDITDAAAAVAVQGRTYAVPQLTVSLVGDSELVLRLSRPAGGRAFVVRLHYVGKAISSVVVSTGG